MELVMGRIYSHIDLDERRTIIQRALQNSPLTLLLKSLEGTARTFFVNSNAISLTIMRSRI